MDGFVARHMHQQSNVGAKIDSVADLSFALVLCAVTIKNVIFPVWIWICIVVITLIRIVAYGIGYYKYHTFSSLHTYMNKVAGVLLFAIPVLYMIVGMESAGSILCILAFTSVFQELVIMIKSKELNRDRKSIFIS
jgi:CDP-diacylglycerol--glycerol-3-phosphate 3-phosphatidyltransferase